ncbi:hypothetical protein [Bartonella sp. AD13SXNS]|uniref:hypothetical protein n=1 Tax=Bartonella sp. AD13SXNS TaxID=3243462 RepID=UPI0035CFEAE4
MVFMNQRNHLRVSPHGALEREGVGKRGRWKESVGKRVLEREGVGKRVLEKAWSGLLFFL